MPPSPPRSTLFPYTTLFRSLAAEADRDAFFVAVRADAGRLVTARADHLELVDGDRRLALEDAALDVLDRKSTRLNSSHLVISYAVFCLKKKKNKKHKKTNTV